MGSRDHSCDGCGNGGFVNDLPCVCLRPPPVPWSIVEEEVERDMRTAADPVNKPEHYIVGNTECADVIASLGLSFFAGSAFKYIWRHGRKDPSKKVEDLRKAVAMLNREIARLEKP